jgi:hypothetical protein
MNVKTLLWAIVGGVAITLLTGLLSNTPEPWVGATFYGYPMPWLTRLVLAPEYLPWKIDALGLIVDLVAWFAVTGVALFGLARLKK